MSAAHNSSCCFVAIFAMCCSSRSGTGHLLTEVWPPGRNAIGAGWIATFASLVNIMLSLGLTLKLDARLLLRRLCRSMTPCLGCWCLGCSALSAFAAVWRFLFSMLLAGGAGIVTINKSLLIFSEPCWAMVLVLR